MGEIINGYDVDLLARALHDAAHWRPCTDAEWARHAERFPTSHEVLMERAREEAMRDD